MLEGAPHASSALRPLTIIAQRNPGQGHAIAIKTNTKELSFYNHLITLYSKSPSTLPSSLQLFNHLPSPPNVVSWTAVISAFSNQALSLRLFLSMLRSPARVLPNQRTLATLLKTASSLRLLSLGLQLHSLSLKLHLSHLPFSASSLVHFYSSLRLPSSALSAFLSIPSPDSVCFSSAIVGLAQNSHSSTALSLFARMISSAVPSTMYSLSAALRAAADSTALEHARAIHAHTIPIGLAPNIVVGAALVDAYGKCGFVRDARRVFDEMLPRANIFGWNAVMAAYAQQGDSASVIEIFSRIKCYGLVADQLSFLAVLTALSNAGLAQEAQRWLSYMRSERGVEPGVEHYTCVVGVLARVGRIQDARRLVDAMPFEPDAAVWRSLLSGCLAHGAAEMGREVGRRLLELSPKDDAAYVMLSNIHAAAGRWGEMAQVRTMMRERGVRKEGGRSWIEVGGEVHVFMAGDRKHRDKEKIYSKLAELMEEIAKLGYKEASEVVLHEMEEAEKRESLWYHSEKLALAYGVVSGAAPPGKALRIVKNLRICRDCHEAFKYISIVLEREILVRDVNRYHRFEKGSCTCGDYW